MGGNSLKMPSSRHSSRERPSISNPSSHSKLIVSPMFMTETFEPSLYTSEFIHNFPFSKLAIFLQTISKVENVNDNKWPLFYLHKMVCPLTRVRFPGRFEDAAQRACTHHCKSSGSSLQNNN